MSDMDKTKLLIVDDLADNLMALEALIATDDREIHKACSGHEALALLLAHDFALAIIDVQMPEIDGFELAELMRGATRTRNIPIIFVSAAGAELNYPFKSYASGAIDFLYKPLDTHAVKSKVQILVELHQQHRAISQQVAALEQSRREQAALLVQLEDAQRNLQKAVKARDDFMSIVAHELRTPLNTMILETQLRKLRLDQSPLTGTARQTFEHGLERDERVVKSMIRLIDDMLDVSRIRTGKLTMRPERLELTALVRQVVDGFGQQLESAGCALSLHAPEPIEGEWDGFRVEQVVVNLLSNALRYGAGKPVHVSVVADGDVARIDVRDHGVGIAPEQQASIFQPFERASSDHVGLGLGLFICTQIAAAHNGSVQLQSQSGEGALFSIRLPLHAIEESGSATGRLFQAQAGIKR